MVKNRARVSYVSVVWTTVPFMCFYPVLQAVLEYSDILFCEMMNQTKVTGLEYSVVFLLIPCSTEHQGSKVGSVGRKENK